jgi:hypothetical protein
MIAPRFRQKQRAACSADAGAMRAAGAQEFTAGRRVRHHPLATAFGGRRPHTQQAVPGVEGIGSQAAQLLTSQARVATEREHRAIADRLMPGDLQNRPPLRLVRDPRQSCQSRDKPSAVAAGTSPQRVTTAADRIGLP